MLVKKLSNSFTEEDLLNWSKSNKLYIFMDETFNLNFDIPINTVRLLLNEKYNKKLTLPERLEHLTLGYSYSHKLKFPSSLKYLKIECNYSKLLDNLPDNLHTLHIGSNYSSDEIIFPSKLKKLSLEKNVNISLNNLPDELKELEIQIYDLPINNLPFGLEKITCWKGVKINKVPFGCIVKVL